MADRKRKLDVFSGDGNSQQNGSALISPLTGRPYSQKYHDILAKRKGGHWLVKTDTDDTVFNKHFPESADQFHPAVIHVARVMSS